MFTAETIVMNELSAETMTGGMDNPIIMGEYSLQVFNRGILASGASNYVFEQYKFIHGI